MLPNFDAHDAVLIGLTVNWAEGLCQVFIQHHTGAKELRVHHLRAVTLGRSLPWGESKSINEWMWQNGSLIIEMQTGDTIRIEGASLTVATP